MSKGTIFWILMLLWLVLGGIGGWATWQAGHHLVVGGDFLLFVLLTLLGWKVFSAPISD